MNSENNIYAREYRRVWMSKRSWVRDSRKKANPRMRPRAKRMLRALEAKAWETAGYHYIIM